MSVCLSVQIGVWPLTFSWFDIGTPYMVHECITMRKSVGHIHDPGMKLTFDNKVNFIEFLTCFLVRPITNFWFYTGIPYLAHGSITMSGCVAYIHGPDTMWTFELKVKLVGFIIWLCVQATAFLSFDTVILCLAHECITMVKCVAYISELYMILTFALKIKIIFSPWIWVWQDWLSSLT